MSVASSLRAVVRGAVARPALTAGVCGALALGGAVLALGLAPSTATSTFVSGSSASFRATERDHRIFGGDAVVVLVRERLSDLVTTADLGRLSELEACLGGQVLDADASLQAFVPESPGARHPPYGGFSSPCGRLWRMRAAQVVYGPGTFLNQAVIAINRGLAQIAGSVVTKARGAADAAYRLALSEHDSRARALALARAAAALAEQEQSDQLAQLAVQSGVSSQPSIDDPTFISEIVFDDSRGVDEPKAKFAYLFPTAGSALIQVRLRSSLSTAQQARAIALIRRAVRMPMFASRYGGTYTVTGEPVLVSDLTSQITRSLVILLLAAVLVMALVLALAFRRRARLLPLVIALGAVAVTFGLLRAIGASLTMAQVAALPIMIGLGVDYAIQFQARALEARRPGEQGPWAARDALLEAARCAAPTIATAALATAAGFVVLELSPIPMVRGFGLLLVVGVAVSLAGALVAGSAALVLAEGDWGVLGASVRGAGELLGEGARALRWHPSAPAQSAAARLGRMACAALALPAAAGERRVGTKSPRRPAADARLRPARARRPLAWRRRSDASGRRPPAGDVQHLPRVLAAIRRRPRAVLAAGLALAALGWVAGTQTAVQSNITRLVPAGMPALSSLERLERITGSSGQIDVVVHAANVTDVRTVRWMIAYERRLLSHYGYNGRSGCARAALCPAFSLPDLFQGQSGALTQASITSLVGALPAYFKQAVLSRRLHYADLSFGIRLMDLARQQRVIDYMRSRLRPPPGVSAQLAGLPVLAAQANAALSNPAGRLEMLAAGLVAVALVLVLLMRRAVRALVPLVAIALATGWSALILFAIGIPLNPMSASLGALVIAISTEFSVLLSERYAQERRASPGVAEALARTYRFTGATVLASGITAIAGFGVLMLSNIRMLADFGFVTVIDLAVSLAGVLLVLPAVLALVEDQRGRLPAGRPHRAPGLSQMRGRRRRRRAVAA